MDTQHLDLSSSLNEMPHSNLEPSPPSKKRPNLELPSSLNERQHSDLDPSPSPRKKLHLIDYANASPKTKDRRVREIGENYHPEAIVRAAIRALKTQGFVNASKALEHIHNDPTELSDVQKFVNDVKKEKISSLISVQKALNHKLDIGMSHREYEKTAAVGNPDCLDQRIWPPLHQLVDESKKLRPEVIFLFQKFFC